MRFSTEGVLEGLFNSYENVKGKLVPRLVSKTRKEEDEPNGILFGKLMDMYVMISYLVEMDEEYTAISLQTAWMLDWGITADQLYRDALENSERLLKPVLRDIREIIGLEKDTPPSFYVLSNEKQFYGASVILYPGLLHCISNCFDADLLLLPSSIHEFLVLPDTDHNPELLRNVVREINKTVVSHDEFLSDSVYRYCRGTGSLTVAQDKDQISGKLLF